MTGRRHQWARRLRNASLALLATAAVATAAAPSGAEPVPGSAGTDTSLPLTDSAVTVRGRGSFADMEFTVNQTADLMNQAISVTWTGGEPTIDGVTQWDGNYVQIMQCWGEPDDSVPENPGPPPEQCVQGAADAVHGGRLSSFGAGNYTLTRVISHQEWPSFDPAVGHLEQSTGLVWRPFRAVDGTVVEEFIDHDFSPTIEGGQYWLNPYFNVITTNEIPGARTLSDGTGSELFEVATGLESSGLGCGQRVQPTPEGMRIPKCWLVIVPRGLPEQENQGRLVPPGLFPVATSPLSEDAWQNRIAIPLDFRPVDTPCQLSDDLRRIGGSELALTAVSSWQPALCAVEGARPYAYGILSDAAARQQLGSSLAGASEMIAVSGPFPAGTTDPSNPVVYAPLTVSGTVIGFNVERIPKPQVPPEEEELRGVRVAELNLTPRLVAKLLTQSYRLQTSILGPSPHEWATANPLHLADDPDFLRFNPEFELLQVFNAKNFGGLVMPSGSSDAAREVWRWILTDPEARAWLAGEPDEWGMRVNPVYATDPALNPSGAPFADPLPEIFPKSDPYCYQGPPRGPGGSVVPPLLCGTDWLPYSQGLRDSARLARAATDGARTSVDPFAPSPDRVYRRDAPQPLGTRSILALTDTPSAAQYGLQTARLSRAGDNDADREFIAPDLAGLTKALSAMHTPTDPAFLEPDPEEPVAGAYPLTAVTYGALTPLRLDAEARADYARFLEYAAGEGQKLGTEVGDLPIGYAPLTEPLKAATRRAADLVRTMTAPTPPADPTTPDVPTPGGVVAPVAGDVPSAAVGSDAPDEGSSPVDSPGRIEAPEDEESSLLTPLLALARNRFVLPALFVTGLVSGLAALEITKRPRRLPTAAAPRRPA